MSMSMSSSTASTSPQQRCRRIERRTSGSVVRSANVVVGGGGDEDENFGGASAPARRRDDDRRRILARLTRFAPASATASSASKKKTSSKIHQSPCRGAKQAAMRSYRRRHRRCALTSTTSSSIKAARTRTSSSTTAAAALLMALIFLPLLSTTTLLSTTLLSTILLATLLPLADATTTASTSIEVTGMIESRRFDDCQGNLAQADGPPPDDDLKIYELEYLVFLALQSSGELPPVTDVKDLPLSLRWTWLFTTCQCISNPNSPPNCCVGDNANIDIDDANGTDTSVTASLMEFCSDVDKAIAEVLEELRKSDVPSGMPSVVESEVPSVEPTRSEMPTEVPSISPTASPTASGRPTEVHSDAPSMAPTQEGRMSIEIQYIVKPSDPTLTAIDVIEGHNNNLKAGLITATTTVLIDILNATFPLDDGGGSTETMDREVAPPNGGQDQAEDNLHAPDQAVISDEPSDADDGGTTTSASPATRTGEGTTSRSQAGRIMGVHVHGRRMNAAADPSYEPSEIDEDVVSAAKEDEISPGAMEALSSKNRRRSLLSTTQQQSRRRRLSENTEELAAHASSHDSSTTAAAGLLRRRQLFDDPDNRRQRRRMRRRLVHYTDDHPVTITQVLDRLDPTIGTIKNGFIVFSTVVVFLGPDDEDGEVFRAIVDGLERSVRDGSFVAAIPDE